MTRPSKRPAIPDGEIEGDWPRSTSFIGHQSAQEVADRAITTPSSGDNASQRISTTGITTGSRLDDGKSKVVGPADELERKSGRAEHAPNVPSIATARLASSSNDERREQHVATVGDVGAFEAAESPMSSSSSEDLTAVMPQETSPADRQQHTERPVQISGQRRLTEDDLMKHLSRRNTNRSGHSLSRETTQADSEEPAEINRLMSQMFGRTRQQNSEEEQTRHVGVMFKHLTIKGMGLGAALQPTFSDPFVGPLRKVRELLTKGRTAVSKPPVKTIIDDFSGCIRPGEMLLVLGRPASGCSSFLKVLGNQRSGFESIDGDVTYGGTDAETMLKQYRGEVLYNPEDDLHYATLSDVGVCSEVNEGESPAQYVKSFLQAVIKLFWIEHTLGTKVGNEFVRGVSGGEKKRVSIAEAMITKASTQCWDNSTRGLDASTALEYVSSLHSLTNMAHTSTAVALYQAGETLYKQFDKVLLIEGGRCAYFGSADDAVAYFKDLGFVQKARWTSADFLTSVTNQHERQIKEGWEDRAPRTAEAFGDIFSKSEQYQRNLAEIEAFEQETQSRMEEQQSDQAQELHNKLPQQARACTHRQFLVMIGDKQSLGGKWGGILFQALIVGSLFYNLPATSLGVFLRGGVLFFILLFNALLALAELTAAFESRSILLKHKSFQFYRPAAYAIAQTVVDVPLVLVQVFVFDIVVYFMANLSRTPSQFFISLLLLFLLTMTMYAFFRAVGALSRNLDIATRFSGVAIQALIVYTGYLIPPSKMHPWFSWLRWINPVQYGFECLMANEFYNLEIQCIPPNLVPQGPGATPEFQSCTIQGSQPGSVIVQGPDYIQVAYQYSRSHLWRNVGFICAFFLFFVTLTAVGMEIQKPNKGGGAVTVFRRGQAPHSVKAALESGRQGGDDLEKNSSRESIDTPDEKSAEEPSSKVNGEASGSDTAGEKEAVAKNETDFTWQNVNYTIPYENSEKKLLQDVQGYMQPGKLTALMGASGAGKTKHLSTKDQLW
ncbi:ABC multidrug transporter atrF [Fulvia fulva]|uniref:ABC multidrug transporter atrF n=1 Tax=Passalora fulva TaxID=5499 RepID=A0A9Q8L658_PASFU|nr:ABC multidrug transporter atrF [Fulvia fulva]KAK4637309.1 ABC multidrug transporter atrF [Fulvia fulva]UJO11539.1 ABC multidrug transporter atrF [Fulvia fulva]